MLILKATFVVMRIILASCLLIVGIFFIVLPFDSATLRVQANPLSWGEYLVIIFKEGGESFAIAGAVLILGVLVAWPRRRAWPFGTKMPVSLIEHHRSTTTRTLTMRLPDVQFSVRRMMAIVAVVAVIVSLMLSLFESTEKTCTAHGSP